MRRVLPQRALCRWLRLVLGVVLLSGLSGCVSFRSISVVGSFGQLVGTRSTAVTAFPTMCEAENIFAGGPPTCPLDKMRRYADEVARYSQAVSRYATALRNLAEFNDPRLSDELQLTLLGLAKLGEVVWPDHTAEAEGIAAAAGQVSQILSQQWRRNKIERLVQTAHPHLIVLIEGLVSRVKLLSESTHDLATDGIARQSAMLAEVDLPAPPPPGATGTGAAAATAGRPDPVGRRMRQADRIALLQFQLFARRSYEALVDYQKSLLAFSRAHSILYEYALHHTTGFSDDTELYDLLKKQVPPILR